jgi:plastocyanin
MAPSSSARAALRHGLGIGVVSLALLMPLTGSEVASATAGAAPAQPSTVKMIHFTFDPPTVTITAGSTVTWTYDETATDLQLGCESAPFRLVPAVSCPGHSTTAAGLGADGKPLWDSGVHRADGFPYSHTFTKPGTYAYYCTVHGGPNPNNPLTQMNGTVVVVAAPATAVSTSGGTTAPSTATSGPATGAAAASGSLPVTGGTSRLALGAASTLGGLAALGLRRRARGPRADQRRLPAG